jgi:hypothetical protein
LLADQSWYRLQIPAEELAFDSFEKVRLWDEIAASLLKKYTERYYTFRKRDWELPHLEYRDLEGGRPELPERQGISRTERWLPHPDRQVAGGDRHQARRAEGRDREGRPEVVGTSGA